MLTNMLPPRRWAVFLGLILNVGLPGATAPVSAQPASDAREIELADVEARALFNAGVAAYDAGRYEDALESFERAYQRSERPALLYNIGQCYDRLRRDDEAVAAFERYLEALPAAENRPQVESRLRALRGAIARRNAPPTADPAPLSPAQVAAAATPTAPASGGPLQEPDSHRPRRIALVTTSIVIVVAVVVLSVVFAGGGGNDYAGSDVGTVFALREAAR